MYSKKISTDQSGRPVLGRVAGYRPDTILAGAKLRPGGPKAYVLDHLAFALNACVDGRTEKAQFYIQLAAFIVRELLQETPAREERPSRPARLRRTIAPLGAQTHDHQ